MRKNFTLLFLMGIFGLFSTNLFAQQDASIDPANIRYWIGEGQNEVVFIVNWAEPDTALAWGYRFSEETVTVKDMMAAIAETDNRFGFEGESFVTDVTFNDGILDLSLAGMWWMYNVNGEMAMNYFDAEYIHNGDYVKFGDESVGVLIDPENYVYVWPKEVAAVYPLAYEAKIDFSEILYWVGEGQNEVVFAVNWNEPNKCLAWGYRFANEAVTVKEIMDAIATADSRFAFDASYGFVSDITYHDGTLDLGLVGMYFMYNVNGGYADAYDVQTVVNGDFIKWGDESCGTEIAPWTYVWTQTVEPVSNPTGISETETNTLGIFPNPAVSESFVTLENAGLNEVSVYDLQGRLVSKETVEAQAGEQVRLSTETLNAGVYFVRVNSANATQTAKLVVK